MIKVDSFGERDEKLIINGGPMGQKVVVQKLALNKIKLGKNSRLSVSKEDLHGLMQSIKEIGLLQPIGVAKSESGYEICYGNRRFMACSKLGFSHIPVIVHENNKASEIDVKNLAENIQRRNISLQEAGRYIHLLRSEGLSSAEIAIRIGASRSYVNDCISAFEKIPDKFKDKLIVSVMGAKKGHTHKGSGKISLATARGILTAQKKYNISREEAEPIYEVAAKSEKFNPNNIDAYAQNVKNGVKDILANTKDYRCVASRIQLTEDEALRLEKKYVDNGPFKSLGGLFAAILKGEISQRVKIEKTV